jgi:hypothetical protein
MLQTGPEGSHVDALERGLKCIDDKGVCSITDGMDILKQPLNTERRKACASYRLPAVS